MDVMRAVKERQQGNYPVSEQLLRTFVAADPYDPLAHFELAMTLGIQGRHREAAAEYREALRGRLSKNVEERAIIAYSSTLRALGEHLRAYRLLADAVARMPGNAGIRSLLGLVQCKLGMYRESVQTLTDVIVSTSDSDDVQRLSATLRHYADDM